MIGLSHEFRRLSGRLACAAAAALAVALGVAFGLAFLAASSAAAEPAYSLDSTPGKLPKTVVPVHYAIELALNPEARTLAGSEVIDIEVREPTARIVLNADDITFTAATIDNAALASEASGQRGDSMVRAQRASIAIDEDAETATLTFPQPLAAGRHQLRIAFTGHINKFGPGLYVVDYPTDKGSKRMISSHLAPADARRVFPCWDEPAFKATFALTVTVPRTFLAVSNMPVAKEEPVNATSKKVSFLPTPKMSSYLLQLTAGEVERLTGEVDGIEIGVIATSGKREQGRFALASAIELLRYFNDYFGVKYPLPKLDLIAIPHGYVSAMEHWGAVTFRESALLFDPTASAGTARRGIFSLIAHELAHQWLGNLVTMAWWDNLWLNEGFATWMESKATEHFHPQWQTWLNNNDEKQAAMSMDERGTARPLQQAVASEDEASEMFDDITYNKGAAVVRMLEGYLGVDVFRSGLRKYMADHAYGNTTTADLWQALEAASGKPIAAIASTFIEQSGVPLVIGKTICVGDEQRMVLRQERFTIGGAAPTSPTGGTGRGWQVPVAIGPLRALRPSETVLLQDEAKEIAAGRCGEPVKLNFGDIGYYRVEYDAPAQTALAKSYALMSPADRVNLLADGWALVESGRASSASYLELVEEIGSEDGRAVWDQVITTFRRLDRLQRNRPERAAFQAYARAKLRPVLDRLGWDEPRPDADGAGILRARLIRTLGELGDEAVLVEAKRRFAAFLQHPASLRPGLREAVTSLAGVAAERRTYNTLLSLARKSTSSLERARYYSAAAGARNAELARETLDLTLTDELPSTLVETIINTVASAGEQPDLAWAFVKRNFSALAARQDESFRNYFAASVMKNFSDAARSAELASFAPAHATSAGRAAAARVEEAIKLDADFKARALPAIDEWIAKRGGRD
jgi:aminopeptidase N